VFCTFRLREPAVFESAENPNFCWAEVESLSVREPRPIPGAWMRGVLALIGGMAIGAVNVFLWDRTTSNARAVRETRSPHPSRLSMEWYSDRVNQYTSMHGLFRIYRDLDDPVNVWLLLAARAARGGDSIPSSSPRRTPSASQPSSLAPTSTAGSSARPARPSYAPSSLGCSGRSRREGLTAYSCGRSQFFSRQGGGVIGVVRPPDKHPPQTQGVTHGRVLSSGALRGTTATSAIDR
jgi:hypothetical protein